MKKNIHEKSLSLRSVFHNCIWHFTFAILTVIVLSGCNSGGGGGGNSGSSSNQPANSPVTAANAQSVGLEKLSLNFSGEMEPGKTIVVTLTSIGTLTNIQWELAEQPQGAAVGLAPSADNRSATVTPPLPGEYLVKVTANVDGEPAELTSNFLVKQVFPYDVNKIKSDTPGANPDDVDGIVSNQVFVSSSSRNEQELRKLLAGYPKFTVLGYDPTFGLLVEFDDTVLATREDLESLRLEQGINSVYYRVHRGKNVRREHVALPNDVKDCKNLSIDECFPIDGSNWHLNEINAMDAWNITPGSKTFLIGVADTQFRIEHEDLFHKVWLDLGNIETRPYNRDQGIIYHGNAVSSIIAAHTDNGKGVTGINWNTKVLAADGMNAESLRYILSKRVGNLTVPLANNSWGYPIPKDFDPASSIQAWWRSDRAKSLTRDLRKMATDAFKDKLFIWSAGNGIGNGASDKVSKDDTQHYGVDAKYENGAIHLLDDGTYSELKNVIVVAALDAGGALACYSAYGQTVDIAAPTWVNAALDVTSGISKYTGGENRLSRFPGTSAAAPVVTGAASLIYSLYPEFSSQEVKEILVSTAKKPGVTERFRTWPCESGNTDKVLLERSIPILDMGAAVVEAKRRIDAKIGLSYEIPNPFSKAVRVDIKVFDNDFIVESVNWSLQSRSSQSGDWQTESSITTQTSQTPFNLTSGMPFYRCMVGATLKNKQTGTTLSANTVIDLPFNEVTVKIFDTVTLAPIPDAKVTMERLYWDILPAPPTAISATGPDGTLKVWAMPGNYWIGAAVDGYLIAARHFHVPMDSVVNIPMTALTSGATGSIGGYVRNMDGDPISGATVRISGGAQTNGYFASATTDKYGYYQISNIKKTDSSGNPIAQFSLAAFMSGYQAQVRDGVVVLAGKDRQENFSLIKSSGSGPIYTTSFEQDASGWMATGLWRRQNLTVAAIYNLLVNSGYVALAPDEGATYAQLPYASDGSFAWWYGSSDTGSFIGQQSPYDSLLSGGTSVSAHQGTLTSPTIDLSLATQPTLRFQTWWEIESVNPNANGFDLMDIQVSVNGGGFTTIKKLNPFVDPNDLDRAPKPFSSAGYNRKPVWVREELDLSSYAGQVVQIRFQFRTVDHLYNGFRGWLIDDFSISEGNI